MTKAYCFCRPGEFAFTTESDGRNLPPAGGRWEPYRIEAISADERGLPVDLVELEREILAGLGTAGYYITTAERALPRVHFVDLHRSENE